MHDQADTRLAPERQEAYDKVVNAQRAFEAYSYLLKAWAANDRLQSNHFFADMIDGARAKFLTAFEEL